METVDIVVEDETVVSVPVPYVPRKPRIRWSKRRKLARQWLRQFAQSTSEDRVNALAMHVGRFHPKSEMGKIASSFVAQNQLPRCEDVVDRFLLKRAKEIHKKAKTEAALGRVLKNSEIVEPQVLQIIDRYWEQNGRGPSWGVIANSLGLDRDTTAALIRHLKRSRIVTYNQDQGSLKRFTDSIDNQSQLASASLRVPNQNSPDNHWAC